MRCSFKLGMLVLVKFVHDPIVFDIAVTNLK